MISSVLFQRKYWAVILRWGNWPGFTAWVLGLPAKVITLAEYAAEQGVCGDLFWAVQGGWPLPSFQQLGDPSSAMPLGVHL